MSASVIQYNALMWDIEAQLSCSFYREAFIENINKTDNKVLLSSMTCLTERKIF